MSPLLHGLQRGRWSVARAKATQAESSAGTSRFNGWLEITGLAGPRKRRTVLAGTWDHGMSARWPRAAYRRPRTRLLTHRCHVKVDTCSRRGGHRSGAPLVDRCEQRLRSFFITLAPFSQIYLPLPPRFLLILAASTCYQLHMPVSKGGDTLIVLFTIYTMKCMICYSIPCKR